MGRTTLTDALIGGSKGTRGRVTNQAARPRPRPREATPAIKRSRARVTARFIVAAPTMMNLR